MRTDGRTLHVVDKPVIVTFGIQAAGMQRHRVSVSSPEGAVLRPSCTESPDALTVNDGETFFVEASVPALPRRNQPPSREERSWELRASADAEDVLKLGRAPRYGPSSAIEIHIRGARRHRAN